MAFELGHETMWWLFTTGVLMIAWWWFMRAVFVKKAEQNKNEAIMHGVVKYVKPFKEPFKECFEFIDEMYEDTIKGLNKEKEEYEKKMIEYEEEMVVYQLKKDEEERKYEEAKKRGEMYWKDVDLEPIKPFECDFDGEIEKMKKVEHMMESTKEAYKKFFGMIDEL